MYHRVRKKMFHFLSAILVLSFPLSLSKSIDSTTVITSDDDEVNNNIIDFDEEYTVKFNKKYGMVPWHAEFDKNSLKYTIIKDNNKNGNTNQEKDKRDNKHNEETTTEDFRVIPLELISTTEDPLVRLVESTTEQDLTVIPLSTTEKIQVTIDDTVTLPTTNSYGAEFDVTTELNSKEIATEYEGDTSTVIDVDGTTTTIELYTTIEPDKLKKLNDTNENNAHHSLDTNKLYNENYTQVINNAVKRDQNRAQLLNNSSKVEEIEDSNKTNLRLKLKSRTDLDSKEDDVPIFTELDTEEFEDIPEDYYDSKDVVPTSAPKTDAISVLFGLAGSVVESVVESVAERVVPKSIYDLFKRMQRQSEALEAERLRSREENGGLGQFGRGILKTISTGFTKPLTQLMESKENGSLDTDRGFVASLASSVSSVANVANGVVDAFKDKVQAIYPGTVWCGDGHSAQARSSDLGLFFFTDTCCRQHDACKIFIMSGESKYGLTNTGLFTRSHCSCDMKFRECLQRTNSLVSAQIGLTYFNVLGPQCFRRAHPIVKCLRRTRITSLKCEEYELDYTKPKMWQWFDNETY